MMKFKEAFTFLFCLQLGQSRQEETLTFYISLYRGCGHDAKAELWDSLSFVNDSAGDASSRAQVLLPLYQWLNLIFFNNERTLINPQSRACPQACLCSASDKRHWVCLCCLCVLLGKMGNKWWDTHAEKHFAVVVLCPKQCVTPG